jgi:transposase
LSAHITRTLSIAPPLRSTVRRGLLADKAYDFCAFHDWLSRRGTTPVIPNKINRRKPYPHNKRAYRHRNKIERMFCRLKDARRIATRYDKCANKFLSAVCLVALIYFWLN